MKTTKKMLNIMVLALALVCLRGVSQAEPMGTAFTYQGRLMDAKKPANDIYDFQFALFDDADPNLAIQVGDSLEANDVDVVDGHFTLALDFGSDVFDGNALWLETAVRPGDSTDPNDFVTLAPRQELTPVPYALQSRGIFVDGHNNVGIGTTSPDAKLEVAGQIKITGGTPGTAKVLTSDGDGLASWSEFVESDPTVPTFVKDGTDWNEIANRPLGLDDGDQVGITSETDPTVLASVKDGVSWVEVSNIPPGFADGVDDADNLGNHIAVKNIKLAGHFLSGDGEDEGVYVNSSGNIGIGTTNPQSKLSVGGEGNSNRAIYGYASSGGDVINHGGWFEADGNYGSGARGIANGAQGIGISGTSWGNNGQGVRGEAPIGNGIGVFGSGQQWDFWAENGRYGNASSIRFKRNVREIDMPLTKIARLRGVYFNWDEEHGGRYDVGMIAEEVGQVLPEIVRYEENGVDAMGMDYSKLTPLLVEAVKALKDEVDELRNQKAEKDNVIEVLKKENEMLENRLAALECSIAKIGMQLEGGGI